MTRLYSLYILYSPPPAPKNSWQSSDSFSLYYQDGHFLLLLLLLHNSNFPGNSRQCSDSYIFLLLLLIFQRVFLSGELSTDSRQSSDSYLFLLWTVLQTGTLLSDTNNQYQASNKNKSLFTHVQVVAVFVVTCIIRPPLSPS